MYGALLGDGWLYALLQHCDEDLAAEQRALGCRRCGGVVYGECCPRKRRGVPRELIPGYGRRLSFCCARGECRKRSAPASVRFLGAKVQLSAVVVLIAALRCGPKPARMRTLQESTRSLQWWERAERESA